MTAAVHPETGAQRPSMLALLGWMLFVTLFAYMVWFGGGYVGIHEEYLRQFSLGVVTIILGGWALLAWRVRYWRPSTAIWPAFAIPLTSMALSTLTSAYPRLGVEYVAWSVLLTALYLLLVRILGLEHVRQRLGGLAAILAGVIGGLYIAVVASRWIDWWDVLGHFAVPPLRPGYAGFTFGGPNHIASAVLLLTVLAIASLGLRMRTLRAGLMILVVIAALTVLMSASRSAWLGLAAAAVATAGVWLVMRPGSRLRLRRDHGARVVIGAGLCAGLVGAVLIGPRLVDLLLARGDGGRPAYFAAAVRMFADEPFVGVGPGLWAARRIAYLEPGELEYTVPHAHNVYLQTAAELGLIGLLAGAVAVAAVVWLVFRALSSRDRSRRTWALATVFVAAYLGVLSLFDFYANLPGALVFLAIPVAHLDASSDRAIGFPERWRPRALGRLGVATLVLGCVLSIAVLAWAESTAVPQERAADLANQGAWEAAMTASDEATAADDHPAHRLTQALAAMALGDWDAAMAAYEAAVRVDDLPQSWLGLALASLNAGRPGGEVTSYLDRAMRVGSQHPAVAYGVGEVYDRLGVTSEADAAYASAIVGAPSLAADAGWFPGGPDPARFERVLDAALDQAGAAGWWVALWAGDLERAQALATDGSASEIVRAVAAAEAGEPEALDRAVEKALQDPQNGSALARTAMAADLTGRPAEADRLRALAGFTLEGATGWGAPVRTAASCSADERLAMASDFFGHLVYRRLTPTDLMPAGLRCLVVGTNGDM